MGVAAAQATKANLVVSKQVTGERAVSTLKTWRLLTKLRCYPQRATALVMAILTLHPTRLMRLETAHWHRDALGSLR
jgi:hypothetical protein